MKLNEKPNQDLHILLGVVADAVKQIVESKGSSVEPIKEAQICLQDMFLPESMIQEAVSAMDWIYSTYHQTEMVIEL